MPIEYEGKKYDFKGLENKIKKQKPGIKSPGGYVHEIEKNQHKARLEDILQKMAGYDNTCPRCGSKNVKKNEDGTRECLNCGLSPTSGSKLAGVGHDNATRGATDEEQKVIDEAKKKKYTYTNVHHEVIYEPKKKQLKARLQRLAIENPDPDHFKDQKYKIIRFYHPSQNRPSRKIKGGLTREEALAHTADPKTSKKGEYFDAFAKE
jgi:ribosomal protein L37AE/L43A